MRDLLTRWNTHLGVIPLLIAAAIASGCAENRIKPEGTSLFGTVQLEGTLTDATGVPLGTEVVERVSGLTVYLTSGGALVDSVATESGSYLFERVTQGTYEIVTWIVPAGVVSTGPFEIGSGRIYTVVPIPISAPLLLVPAVFATAGPSPLPGDADLVPIPGTPVDSLSLAISPNPWTSVVNIEYLLASDSRVDLRVEDVRKSPVKDLVAASQPAGRHTVTWDGLDSQGEPVLPGLFIVTSYTDTTEGWDLMFREDAP